MVSPKIKILICINFLEIINYLSLVPNINQKIHLTYDMILNLLDLNVVKKKKLSDLNIIESAKPY